MTDGPGPVRPASWRRDIVLEGYGLAVAAAALLAALAGAFSCGRWYEARGRLETAEPRVEVPPEARSREIEGRGSRFEDVAETGALEPRREARAGPTTAPASSPPAATAVRGAFYVQVFAGRSREAAERVVAQLAERGHAARMETTADGRDTLFRVQVGGFETRSSAESAVGTLQREGFRGAFVARVP